MEMREHVPLAPLTTFKIGGSARYFATITTLNELREAVQFAQEAKLPFFVLGGGSNTLVEDKEYPGVMLLMRITGVEWRTEGNITEVVVGAGESWDEFVVETIEKNLWGLENLSYVPGTVGAAPIQNIECYGAESGKFITQVDAYDAVRGEVVSLTHTECMFAYRTSIFKLRPELIVTHVHFQLSKNPSPNISYKDLKFWFCERAQMVPSQREIREALRQIRGRKFPDLGEYGTAGSFFKNPILSKEKTEIFQRQFTECPIYQLPDGESKIPVAWLIEHVLQMKGIREGDVGTWPTHALVIVNYGKATYKDVSDYAEKIVSLIDEKTGIVIEREVVLLKK